MSWFLPIFLFQFHGFAPDSSLLLIIKAISQVKKGHFGPKNIFLYQKPNFLDDKANSN